MTHWGYVIAGYVVTFVVLAAYVAWIVTRTRSLASEAARIDGVDDRP